MREVVGAVYDRAFSCRTEDVLHKGMPGPQRLRWLFTDYPIYYITACAHNRRRILDRPDVHKMLY